MRKNHNENDLIDAINRKRATEKKLEAEYDLFKQLLPALRAVAQSGGGADQMLKKSEPLAAMRIIETAARGDPANALKAATEILNRVSGRPVERTMTLFADVGRLNEKDLDGQIARLLKQHGSDGAHQYLGVVLDEPIKALPKKKRKPKTPKILEQAKEANDRSEEPNA